MKAVSKVRNGFAYPHAVIDILVSDLRDVAAVRQVARDEEVADPPQVL
jgi:hypothetical protein